MSMILNTSIKKLMKGYPTVSDKYDVTGGILDTTSAAVEFGTVMAYTTVDGVFAPVATATTVDRVAGVALSPNVKLTDTWHSASQETLIQPGEAVNLCFNGFMAVEVDATVAAAVKPGDKVGLTSGKLVVASTSNILAGWYFTGCVEGSLVEIEIRR